MATQTDPRIQHTTNWSLGHNRLTKLYKPFQSLPFSGYNGETVADADTVSDPILYEQGTDIALASGLEALHHYYEAAGRQGGAFDPDAVSGPAGTLRQFVDARRAFGNSPAFTGSTPTEWRIELKEQRARDLYMGGFRLGDLRRWDRMNELDSNHVFPTGLHPNNEWGDYGTAKCFPLPLEEYQGNPKIDDPHT